MGAPIVVDEILGEPQQAAAGASNALKDLFSGALGGMAQVLIGKSRHNETGEPLRQRCPWPSYAILACRNSRLSLRSNL